MCRIVSPGTGATHQRRAESREGQRRAWRAGKKLVGEDIPRFKGVNRHESLRGRGVFHSVIQKCQVWRDVERQGMLRRHKPDFTQGNGLSVYVQPNLSWKELI